MNETDLHSSLLFLMIKLEEAKTNPMADKNFVAALTEVLRYFRDNGELKKAYKGQKDSYVAMTNGPWAKLMNDYLASKVQEDGINVELPDMDSLIGKLFSDEHIEKKFTYLFGDNT